MGCCEGWYLAFVLCTIMSPLQTADLPWTEDFHTFWSVWLSELLRGHPALLAAAHWGQLSRFQLLPQLHTCCRCSARYSLLSAQRESEGKTPRHTPFGMTEKSRRVIWWSYTWQDPLCSAGLRRLCFPGQLNAFCIMAPVTRSTWWALHRHSRSSPVDAFLASLCFSTDSVHFTIFSTLRLVPH